MNGCAKKLLVTFSYVTFILFLDFPVSLLLLISSEELQNSVSIKVIQHFFCE